MTLMSNCPVYFVFLLVIGQAKGPQLEISPLADTGTFTVMLFNVFCP